MTISYRQTGPSWGRRIGVAAGTAAAAAAIPLIAVATAHADTVGDMTIGALSPLSDLSTAAISELIPGPVSPIPVIPEAIAAAAAPINEADTSIAAELAASSATLTSQETAVLMSQQTVDSAQLNILDMILSQQQALTGVDATDLASLDGALATADQSVLEATQTLISSFADGSTLNLTDAFDLANADFTALGADLHVIFIDSAAQFLTGIGLSPDFLF